MTAQSIAALASSLSDTGIAQDLLSVAANGTLTYSGALHLLQDAAARGSLTQAEFSSLQSIASTLNSGLTANSYVASVFSQLVDGSNLNAVWTGGQKNSSALGNLAVGSTTAQMNELIGKWFLGTDNPTANYNTTNDGGKTLIPNLASYTTSSLPLFGSTGTPATSDINMGYVPDTVLMSTLVDYAQQHPAQAALMIQYEGNGVYGVRFYVNGNQEWVTVNNQLPVTSSGALLFDGQTAVAANAVLWAPLVEKAFVEFAAGGGVQGPTTGINSYANAGAAQLTAMENITGCSSITSLATTPTTSSTTLAADAQFIVASLSAHDDVQLVSGQGAPSLKDGSGNLTLATNTAFAVTGYDSTTGDFIIQSPQGYSSQGAKQGYDTVFEMSISQIASVSGFFAVDNSGVSGPDATATGNIHLVPISQQVLAGETIQVSSLFSVAGSRSIPSKYVIQLTNGGTLNLNGATNLASTAEAAQNEFVVSASDLPKLTLTGITSSTSTLSVALTAEASGGLTASATVALSLSGTTAAIAAAPVTLTAGQTVSLSSLFDVTGPAAAYYIFVPNGGGTINLNGAQNLDSGSPGNYEISAASLPQVTFTAPTQNVSVALQLDVYAGSTFSGLITETLSVISPVTAAIAATDLANGQYGAASAVSDSAVNIFANIVALQALTKSGYLTTIALTDSAIPTISGSAAEIGGNIDAISLIFGKFGVAVTDTAANVSANIDALQALYSAGHLSGISISSTTSNLTLTGPQLANDAGAVGLIGGAYTISLNGATVSQATSAPHLASVTVSDSAANVSAGLDVLGRLAASGALTGISLTDAGVPTISVALSQFNSDAVALKAISGSFSLDIIAPDVSAAPSSTQTLVGMAGHATIVQLPGDAAHWSATPQGNGQTVALSTGNATFTLTGVTALQFSDYTAIVASQIPTVAGGVSSFQVASLYAAVLARAPDAAGLAYYENLAATNSGISIANYAGSFLSSTEYTSNAAHNYAQTSAGDAQFITDTYSNLLHRAPAAGDIAWYQANVLAPNLAAATPGTAAYTQAELQAHAAVLADFSQSAEFMGDVQITAQHPADAQHWLMLI